MPSKLIVAAAGSGKTEYIIRAALDSTKRILIVTYTNENLDVIRARLKKAAGIIPVHITIQSWYGFLLKEAVRPYQNALYEGARVSTLNFEAVPDHLRYVSASDIDNYFFTKTGKIYRDRVSDFSCKCNAESNGRTIDRLTKMYDHIFIDEVQDMAGWDLEFLDLLLNSSIELTFVGDVRQATYATNNARKNKQFRGAGIIKWFEAHEKRKSAEYNTKKSLTGAIKRFVILQMICIQNWKEPHH
jgi:superfamily I DNA/RNA helicase